MTASAMWRHGACIMADGSARFALWAPGCEAMTLECEGAAPVAMVPERGGWFIHVGPARPGTRYRFRVRDDLAVPDPASRLQDGDVHDASILVGPDAFSWRHPDWRGRPWHEAVIYELHPGICGGFPGIEATLPDLAALGITAVELMPIADFPGRHNWGYDGTLPYAPDTSYGTPDQLKHMIDTAHGLGLMVFLDVVYNHFGPDGNYLHVYAPEFFREDIETPWGSAIDMRRPEVRDFFIGNAIWWIEEYRFDGLRFDAVHAIEDHDFLPVMAREIRNAVAPGRHVHLVLENDDNDAAILCQGGYDAQWADDTHHCLHVLLTGEQSGYYRDYPDAAAQLARCLEEGFAYQGEASPHRDGAPRGTPSGDLPPTAFVAFLQNHDQVGNRGFGERLTALADPAALRAAILLLLLSPQIPLLFMGEERGTRTPFLYFTDHLSPDLAEAVRYGRRAEFARFDAFADPAIRETIPDPNDPETFRASIPDADVCGDAAEWLSLYRSLLDIRHERIVPGIPGTRSCGATSLGVTGVRASWRLGDGTLLTIAANFGPEPVRCQPGLGELIAAVPAPPAGEMMAGRSAAVWMAAP